MVCLPKMWDFDANMQNTAEGCECFKFWRRQVKVLVSYHQNRCSVFIPKDAKYILMNKLCGVLFDGRDADRVILVYANLCNNLLFGKSPRAFFCLDQLYFSHIGIRAEMAKLRLITIHVYYMNRWSKYVRYVASYLAVLLADSLRHNPVHVLHGLHL